MKNRRKFPIMLTVGYGINMIFLLLIMEQFCRLIILSFFNSALNNPFNLFFQLFIIDDTKSLAYFMAGIMAPLASAILWGIFYLFLHIKQKKLPSKKTVIMWAVFLLTALSQWFINGAVDSGIFKWVYFYFDYFYYTLPFAIMLVFLFFNIIDLVRLIKSAKQETNN